MDGSSRRFPWDRFGQPLLRSVPPSHPQNFDPIYLDRLLRIPAYVGEYQKNSTGVTSSRLRLYADKFLNISLIRPPFEEQQAIAKYVRRLESQVNAAIRAKQRLISILLERKQITVSQAVTCGLNATVEQKDSGVDWIGNVPAHWPVIALRHRYHQRLGKMLDQNKITGRWLVPYLRNSDVQWDSINTTNLPLISISPAERSEYLLSPGDLLVCEEEMLDARLFGTARLTFTPTRRPSTACAQGTQIPTVHGS